jgi:hypothetical protein
MYRGGEDGMGWVGRLGWDADEYGGPGREWVIWRR